MARQKGGAADPIEGLAVGLNEDAKAARKAGENEQGSGAESPEDQASGADQAGDNQGGEVATASVSTAETNAGKREAAIEGELGRIERVGEEAELDLGSLGNSIVQTTLDIFRHRRFNWTELSSSEQRDITTAIDMAVKATLRQAVRIIRADGQETIRAKLEKYGDKGGEVTLSLKIAQADDQTILALHRASGKEVLIIAADAEGYLQEPPKAEGDDDQADLAFEAGSDEEQPEIPEDDSDLAGGADEEEDQDESQD